MSFFDNDKKIFSASAPGRLDVMGGIADYSGSLLLQMPISQTTQVQLQERNDSVICIRSVISPKKIQEYKLDYHLIENKSPEEAGKIIKAQPGGDWAAYVIGSVYILQKEKKLSIKGINIEIRSKVPLGKGVASSAALEVATMNALCKMYDLQLTETELPVLAQKAENSVVGAACGLMDQLSVHLGQKNKLLPLICQPYKILPAFIIPKGISFCGIDSGVRHSVGAASYTDVRAAAFMAYTVIASLEGVNTKELSAAKNNNEYDHLPFKGYLANIPVSIFESKFAEHLPESISGMEFINKYAVSIDDFTTIDSDKTYHLLSCARHPVYENLRINLFQQLIQQFSKTKDKEKSLQLMGELMLQSHASYSSVGLGNDATDEIVKLAMEAGTETGIYGARVSGGGNGGAVVIMCHGKEGKQTAKKIYQGYKKKTKKKIFFIHGSSHGASILNQPTKINNHESYNWN